MTKVLGFGAVLCTTAVLCSSASYADPGSQQKAFFETLLELCGTRYVGETTYPEVPGEDWRDKVLTVTIEYCEPEEIRMPLVVGEDHSRTWVLRPVAGGLELKHDHRYEDGTPHEVTQYGGTTVNPGSAGSQAFPADTFTAALIPEASTNVWSLTLSPDASTMTYYLERHDAPRFKAVLHRQQ